MSLVRSIDMLVPHRSPMLLIDAVLASDDSGAWAVARLQADSAFVKDGRVSTAVGLEYLAQTAAAFFTLQSSAAEATVRQGMLIACPRLDADIPWFMVGDTLLLTARPASRMPTSGQGRGLVKFVGDIYVIPHGVTLPVQMPAAARGVVRAELSVYL
jgi:predicted hotdog family 3-hydroxylacyl-ACP dehydratase